MKNILYLIYCAGNGGSEKYVYDMIIEAKKRGYGVFLGYDLHGKLVEDLESIGVKCFRIAMPTPFDRLAIKRIREIVTQNNIDIIHAQFARENYLAILASLKLKQVEVVYTNHIILNEGKLKQVLNRFITARNKAIIAVSEASRNKMKSSGVRADKIQVIYNGVDINRETAHIVRTRDNSNQEFKIINVSRFTSEKGIIYLVESFKKLCDIIYNETASGASDTKWEISDTDSEIPDVKLVLVGDGADYSKIDDLVSKLGLRDRVVMTGYRNDVSALLKEADLYVNSSSNENLSFSIIEAMSYKIPVIATDVGGNPEIVSGTNCGILVKYGSDDMVGAMYKMITDLPYYNEMSNNAYELVLNKFSKEVMLKKTFDIYE